MQTNYRTREMHERLWALLAIDEDRRSKIARDSTSSECLYPRHGSDVISGRNNFDSDQLSLPELLVTIPPGFVLPKDKTITISVIKGPSKGLIRRLVKPHISIGRTGGGADIELEDRKISDMHCAVGVKDSIIRLCDLDSQGGTYIENQRVTVAPLEHLSEFRVGSSVLLVTILPERVVSLEEEADEFEVGKEE